MLSALEHSKIRLAIFFMHPVLPLTYITCQAEQAWADIVTCQEVRSKYRT